MLVRASPFCHSFTTYPLIHSTDMPDNRDGAPQANQQAAQRADFDIHLDAPSFMLVKCGASSSMFSIMTDVFLCGLSLGCIVVEAVHDLTGTGIGDKRYYTGLGLILLRTAYEFAQLRGTQVHEITV